MSTQLKRVALVVGGGDSIGRGITESIADNGFDVVVNDVRDLRIDANTVDACAAIQRQGTNLVHVSGDIASAQDRRSILDCVRAACGRLDVLVNIIGVAPSVPGDLMQASEESFHQQIAHGLKGPYFFTQLAARWMAEQKSAAATFRGVVINVSPIIAPKSVINRGEYSVIKAGTAMATQLWAHRLAEFGVAVYEVRPGLIHTEMSAAVADKYDRLMAGNLLVENRWGQPEDIGRAVAMLARGEITYGTGNVLHIDGGMALRRL